MPADLVPLPRPLLDRLGALGVDVPRALDQAGLARDRVMGLADKPRVTTDAFFAFWRAVAAQDPPADLGLRLGAEPPPHQYDVVSLAALHAPTLGEGLKKLARYKRLLCPEEITVEPAGAEARVRFHWVLAAGDPPDLLVDGTFARVLALARRGTGRPLAPRRIEVTRRRAAGAHLARHFACEILFDAPVDLIVFDRALLDAPFVTHNQDLLEALVPGLDAALAESAGPAGAESLADDARRALGLRMRGERPSVDKIARDLHLSPRTLQRRLEEAGTSYQKLLDEVRRASARRLLASTDLDAGEVAFFLGFEELNSFTRAFHAWEGTTPARWRASLPSRPD